MIRTYGIREKLNPLKAQLSDIINSCMVDALAFPEDKRAHRFFPIDAEDFYFPAGRTEAYLALEVSMMAGRSEEARKKLLHLLFERIEEGVGIGPVDVEIMIYELPAWNFGFRGMTGDEAVLNYKIDV
jgi:5-carboxymethyl-2-hydroxymuconate isomerase